MEAVKRSVLASSRLGERDENVEHGAFLGQ